MPRGNGAAADSKVTHHNESEEFTVKKAIGIILMLCMVTALFTGCSGSKKGSVYYLNFKPEQDGAWQTLAKEYTNKTGIQVKVLTAAEGTYSQTLTSEIEKTDAPTLFQVSGAVALDTWRDYCYDLKGSAIYGELTSDDFALIENDKVLGVAYVYEGFGLITNKKLLSKAGYSVDDITSFDKLKEVAESITKRKDELGFSAFSSSGLDSSSSWRFSGHLANLPLFYEFRDDGITKQPASIKGTYLNEYKRIWDLYINNATCQPSVLSTKTGSDAAAEFTSEKCVFFQNGTWMYSDVKSIGDDNLGMIPMYFGVDDRNQGLCCGTENYWAVNAKASEEDIKATLDFLEWVVTSDQGTEALAKNMGFVSPFKKAKQTENVLCNIMNDYVASGRYNVSWAFNYTPNVDNWRTNVVSALTAYSAGKGNFDAVKTAFVDGWAKEYASSHR